MWKSHVEFSSIYTFFTIKKLEIYGVSIYYVFNVEHLMNTLAEYSFCRLLLKSPIRNMLGNVIYHSY